MKFRPLKGSAEPDHFVKALVSAGWNQETADRVMKAFGIAYWAGDFERARALVSAVVQEVPELETDLAVFAWRCDEAIRRTESSEFRAGRLAEVVIWQDEIPRSPFKLLAWLWRRPKATIRCKWCGSFQEPRGYGSSDPREEHCGDCGRPFVGPDLYWDSMDGFAYSAGRGSWQHDQEAIEGEWNRFYNKLKERHPDRLE